MPTKITPKSRGKNGAKMPNSYTQFSRFDFQTPNLKTQNPLKMEKSLV